MRQDAFFLNIGNFRNCATSSIILQGGIWAPCLLHNAEVSLIIYVTDIFYSQDLRFKRGGISIYINGVYFASS